jgi:hypothetical protein
MVRALFVFLWHMDLCHQMYDHQHQFHMPKEHKCFHQKRFANFVFSASFCVICSQVLTRLALAGPYNSNTASIETGASIFSPVDDVLKLFLFDEREFQLSVVAASLLVVVIGKIL